MIIGVPKEIKNNENRVAITPQGVAILVHNGHQVLVQKNAGIGSGFNDLEYEKSGAHVTDVNTVFGAELILKVKEPLKEEYNKIKEGQIIFTYFHFSACESLTKAMINSKAVCIAYETVTDKLGGLPLLLPMSQVAGRLSIQEGARFLLKNNGGKGVLLGGVPGVKPGKVVIIGGGVVGTEAAKMAVGLGANVCLLDVSAKRMLELSEVISGNFYTRHSNRENIIDEIKNADLVVSAVLIPGAKAPKLITKDMLKLMEKGSVIVDVAVDQGGCVETMHPTTHEDPIFEVKGILHYGVANMPGAVPKTSTIALSQVTLPYLIKIASDGWKSAVKHNEDIKNGLNIVEGKVVNKEVAEAFNMPCSTI